MQTPVAKILQSNLEIGWGQLGSVNPLEGAGAQVTLHDVHLLAEIAFEPGGPFRVVLGEDRYDNCRPVNYRNLRPGCDYDRVILESATRPRLG
ncbi:hypothetical protein LLH00_09060 [bacterium]|nr:hypothetical protein [bacterium]